MKDAWGSQTKASHAGMDQSPQDISPPLHTANTYILGSAEEAAQAFKTESRPIHSRWGNPAIAVMEKKVATLEDAEDIIADLDAALMV